MINNPFYNTLLAGGSLPNPTTATTQAAYDDSTNVATTAYVDNSEVAFATAWFRDDFIGSNSASSITTVTAVTGDTQWQAVDIAAALTFSQVAGTFANPGMINLATGSSSGNGGVLYKVGGTSLVASLGAVTGNAPWEVNFFTFLNSTANVSERVGFVIAGQNAADAPTAGLYVEYNTANTGNTSSGYTLVGMLASTPTYASGGNSVVPSTTTPDHIRIASTIAGTVNAYVNGTLIGTLTSGYTAAAVGVFLQIITRTAAGKSLTIDAVSYMAKTGRT